MKFSFNVNLTDRDYLDFNLFGLMRSPYGKKQLRSSRIILIAMLVIYAGISLYGGGFTRDTLIGMIPPVMVILLALLLLKRFYVSIIKWNVKSLKKTGKMAYSPVAVLEFSEDSIIETAAEERTEKKYSMVERISIVDNKVIYIHTNNVMAYILPMSCFESKEQYNSFLEFISSKCLNVDTY